MTAAVPETPLPSQDDAWRPFTAAVKAWPRERLVAFAAAGTRQRVIRAVLETYPTFEDYLAAWGPGLAEQGLPDPNSPEIDLGDGWMLTAVDDAYPAWLRDAPAAPLLLFGRGEQTALATIGVAVVGTREMTQLGQTVATLAVDAVADLGAPIVSGLARGVDTAAHTRALEVGAPTVAVLATGPDVVIPRENVALAGHILDAGGAIVSEHPFRTGPNGAPGYVPAPIAARLMARNRIIAGLSALTIPAEASMRSGTMGTVWSALTMGRPLVVAVPRAGARGLPGAQVPMFLADHQPRTAEVLRRAGAPAATIRVAEGRIPLASACAPDRDTLALALRMTWQMSPHVPATAPGMSRPAVPADTSRDIEHLPVVAPAA